MAPDQSTPTRRTPEQIRDDLERLRKDDPHNYGNSSARLLRELEQAEKARHRYAIT
jgi:hypothetical protein